MKRRFRFDNVFDEPQYGRAGTPTCEHCGYDLSGLPSVETPCPECGGVPHDLVQQPDVRNPDDIDHTVWDEPAVTSHTAPTAGDQTYARWYEHRQATTPAWIRLTLITAVALAAGPWAVLGAFIGSGNWMGSFFGVAVFTPIVEELMKVAALTLLLERRPYLFRSAAGVLATAAAGGLAFAIIENFLYLTVYIPNPDVGLIVWRWTVCVGLHVGCSLIAGLGLARVRRVTHRTKTRPDLTLAFPCLVIAMVIHGLYNATVTLLALTGFDF